MEQPNSLIQPSKGFSGKIIFRIIHDGEKEECNTKANQGAWSKDEHTKFIEGIKIHGLDWTLITGFVGTRLESQVISHAKHFLARVEDELPNNVKTLDYIRSKSTEYFLNTLFYNTFEKARENCKDKDHSYGYSVQKKLANESGMKKRKTRSVGSIEESMQVDLKPKKAIKKKQVIKKQKNNIHKKPNKPPEVPTKIENPHQFPGNQGLNHNTIQAMAIQDHLQGILGNLYVVSQKLESEIPNGKSQNDADPQIGYYWTNLHNLSIALQHMVSDISLIYSNTIPMPPPPVMYPPGYYPANDPHYFQQQPEN